MTDSQSPAPVAGAVETMPDFDDPRVQAAYEVLCSPNEPPTGEHWEGFSARRIVAALAALHPQPAPAVAVDALDALFRENAIEMTDRNGELYDAIAARSAPAVAERVPLTVYLDEEMSGLLRQTIGDDPETNAIRLEVGDGHSGWGLYVSLAEYPEEGAIQLASIGGSGSAQEGKAK